MPSDLAAGCVHSVASLDAHVAAAGRVWREWMTGAPCGLLFVLDPSAIYRPRHPELSVFYKLLERHFDRYVYAYEERFEPRSGPLRPAVRPAVEAFLACGRPEGGFARVRCDACHAEHLLAYSCHTRNFCPSCQAKRAALFAEGLVEDLAGVPHRHWTFTIPRALRGLFERDRRLLGLLSRTAYDAILRTLRAVFARKDVRPGVIASIQTFGSFANFHPHLHCLVTEGVFTAAGEFLPLETIDTSAVEELFRRLLLVRLHRAERLSESFMEKLLGWSPSGFSCCATEVIPPADKERLERLARYLTRAPLRLDAVVEDEEGRIRLATPLDPATGATERILDPLDWIHAVTSQIPDRGKHAVRRYGAYANRVRAWRKPKVQTGAEISAGPAEEVAAFTKARKASWARLLRKLLEVDPLLCLRCGGSMRIVAFIDDQVTIDRILKHIASPASRAFDPFEARPPPPN
jgi:hypothetical protein